MRKHFSIMNSFKNFSLAHTFLYQPKHLMVSRVQFLVVPIP
jgi:hypothetical protein